MHLRLAQRLRAALPALTVSACALAAYADSLAAGFTLDNRIVVLGDPRLRAWSAEHLRQIFTESYWWPAFPSDLYRPLTTLSFLINYTVFGNGAHAAGYHWINLALHVANCLLVLRLARALTESRRAGAWAGALFAVHPLAVESVTNLVGRSDLLATFAVLAGALVWMRLAAAGRLAAQLAWGAALAAVSCLGMLCKENGIMIVAFAGLHALLYELPAAGPRRIPEWAEAARRRVAPAALALVPMCAGFLCLRRWLTLTSPIQWQYFVDNPIARASALQAWLTAMKVQGDYLRLLVWPAGLSCDYSFNQVPLYGTGHWASDVGAWLALLVVATLLVIAWRIRRRLPALSLGILLYFAFLLPTANLLKVIGSIMAERFLYLPMVGAAVAAAVVVDRLQGRIRLRWPRLPAAAPAIVLASVVAALGVRTQLRNRDWKDDLSLWRSAAWAAPNSFKAHKGLAAALLEADPSEAGLDQAIAEAEKGLAILNDPVIDAHVERRDVTLFIDLGRYYQLKADLCMRRRQQLVAAHYGAKAVAVLQRAATVDSWVNQESRRIELIRGVRPEAIRSLGRVDVHRDLSTALFQSGQPLAAIATTQAGLRIQPFDPSGWEFMSMCFRHAHRPHDAAIDALVALLIDFHYAPAWEELIAAYAELEPRHRPVERAEGRQYILSTGDAMAREDLATACFTYEHFLQADGLKEAADRFHAYAARTFHYRSAIDSR